MKAGDRVKLKHKMYASDIQSLFHPGVQGTVEKIEANVITVKIVSGQREDVLTMYQEQVEPA